MKLGIVVQRYGMDINGGAELHARYVAEHLARHHEIEVLTTCARDYITWQNALEPGLESIGGVPVRRFPVRHPRDPEVFGRWSERVFDHPHSLADELAWLDAEGPTSSALLRHVSRQRARYDYFLFFSARYYHAYRGARAVSDKAVLVPTAERDPAVGLTMFGPVFRGVRGIMYNSLEERAMIQAVSRNLDVPSVVVGIGSEVPEHPDPERFRRKFGLSEPFAIYVGRIDENKGCTELFDHFAAYAAAFPRGLSLVLIGNAIVPVPSHPRIRHLGFVSDEDKFDAMAGADLLVMPSFYESLSMVVLEAWALGRPVLVNGRCDVLRGQCVRSGAGLYYENVDEFVQALYTLEASGPLNRVLGRGGRAYYAKQYAWPIIERKYLDMLERLQHENEPGRARLPLEPQPGWWARRRPTLPPARQVVNSLPAGPVLKDAPETHLAHAAAEASRDHADDRGGRRSRRRSR